MLYALCYIQHCEYLSKLNKSIQGVVHSILKDESEIAAKKSLDIMVHLYRKRVWVVSFWCLFSVSPSELIYLGRAFVWVGVMISPGREVAKRSRGSMRPC